MVGLILLLLASVKQGDGLGYWNMEDGFRNTSILPSAIGAPTQVSFLDQSPPNTGSVTSTSQKEEDDDKLMFEMEL